MFTTTGMAINMMQLTKAMCDTLDILHYCCFLRHVNFQFLKYYSYCILFAKQLWSWHIQFYLTCKVNITVIFLPTHHPPIAAIT